MGPIEIAKRVLASIQERKMRIEGMAVVDESTWQYASGMMNGALEVLRALEDARGADLQARVAELSDAAVVKGWASLKKLIPEASNGTDALRSDGVSKVTKDAKESE